MIFRQAAILLDLNVPESVPGGRTTIQVLFPDTRPRTTRNEKIHLTRQMVDDMMRGETLRSLTGILHTRMTAEEIRAERLREHDRID